MATIEVRAPLVTAGRSDADGAHASAKAITACSMAKRVRGAAAAAAKPPSASPGSARSFISRCGPIYLFFDACRSDFRLTASARPARECKGVDGRLTWGEGMHHERTGPVMKLLCARPGPPTRPAPVAARQTQGTLCIAHRPSPSVSSIHGETHFYQVPCTTQSRPGGGPLCHEGLSRVRSFLLTYLLAAGVRWRFAHINTVACRLMPARCAVLANRYRPRFSLRAAHRSRGRGFLMLQMSGLRRALLPLQHHSIHEL